MKRIVLPALSGFTPLTGCNGIKVNKTMLGMVVSSSNKVSTDPAYADLLEKRIGVPYVESEA